MGIKFIYSVLLQREKLHSLGIFVEDQVEII